MVMNSWLDQLQATGCRLTGARRSVVKVMQTTTRALTPVQVFDEARRRDPRLGLVTVYRTLEKLEQLNLIQRVHQPGGCNAYLPHAEGHQHLIICQACGKARYFEGDDMQTFFAKVAGENGFTVNEHWLQLFGLCSECSAA